VACIEIERLAHASDRTTIWHTRLVILYVGKTLYGRCCGSGKKENGRGTTI
jgi:hypothetical protein